MPSQDVRYDNIDHLPKVGDIRVRCKNEKCNKKSLLSVVSSMYIYV